MATYNGEQYLGEQIDSLLAQTYKDWHLYIHDDGSKDSTIAVIKEYCQQHPDKISLLEYPSQEGACKNFMSLLERVDAPYYMFCDQDDVWMPEKMETEMNLLESHEERGVSRPILIYSDLVVVDAQLSTINKSFFEYAGIHPEFLTTFNELGADNPVTGCTMLFNKAVKDILPSPFSNAIMHDAFITLCTLKANGILSCLRTPLLLYRQHDSNTLGASDKSNHALAQRLYHWRRTIKLNKERFNMLRELDYGSFWKFIYYKLKYKVRISH